MNRNPGMNMKFKSVGIKNNSGMKRLVRYIWEHNRVKLTIVGVCLLITALASSASGLFLYMLTARVITPALSDGFDSVLPQFAGILTAMICVYAAGVAAAAAYSFIMARMGQRTLNSLRKDMFARMEKLPVRYFDRNKHGDIMSYYTNDIDAIRQFISQSMVQIVNTLFTLIILTCYMLYYSIWLTLVVYGCAAVMLVVVKNIGGKSADRFVRQQHSTAQMEGFIEEIANGQKVVKVFTHEDRTLEDFRKLNAQVRRDASGANEYGNIVMPILGGIGNYMYVLLAFIGGALCMVTGAGNFSLTGFAPMSVAVIISFLAMFRQFGQSIAQVSHQTSMCAMAFAGAKRVFALIDEKPEEDNGYVSLVTVKRDENGALVETDERTHHWAWKHPHHDGTTTLSELKGRIVLDGVDFGYDEGHQVLYDVSISAEPGQKTAFVGATGAGKTTITNLINRFYDIQDGKIRYDGININKIKKPDLRRSLTVVLQDTNLFTGTVMDNIRYGRPDATDEEVYEAARIANAYDFIVKLPEGFNTMLTSDGANLSQGQRQLLSIARAAVADTPVLILDEATSSIDTRTEKIVQKGTDMLMQGRTVFVIAHRLSTVQSSDLILVLDHGHVIERGSHDELIKLKGTYYALYTGAFELE